MAMNGLNLDVAKDQIKVNSVGSDQAIHLDNLNADEAELIQKTLHAAIPAIQGTDFPLPSDPSLNGKVTLGSPQGVPQTTMSIDGPSEPVAVDPVLEPMAVDAAPEAMDVDLDPEKLETSLNAITNFPALAWESVKAGLAKEKQSNEVLNRHIKEAEDHQKTIDMLLEFSAELTALPDKKDNDMTPKMKTLVKELKERGIDLKLDDNSKISKEKALELKSLNSSFIDQRRSKLQILFTTKIQVVIQNMGSIMEALKNVIKDNTRLNSTIIGHSGGR